MLELHIKTLEGWDEIREEFIPPVEFDLRLEHSLVSLSKWESKWKKPFITNQKTLEELLDYIRCMTLTQNIDPELYRFIGPEDLKKIEEYISDERTATTFPQRKEGVGRVKNMKNITSEEIYGWMILLEIPMECQKWHLSRLLTLIKVVQLSKEPPKKMGKHEIMRQNSALNASRRAKYGSRG